MTKRLLLVIMLAVIVTASVSHAGLLSEDVCYWYRNGDGSIGSEFNPTSQWISAHLPSLVFKIQQTVYDQEMTSAILTANGDGTVPGGYLYAYSVTNLGWTETMSMGGMDGFGVQWAVAPLLVTIDHSMTSPNWQPIIARKRDGCPVDGAGWLWRPQTPSPGLLPGGTQGGFWAVSNVGTDMITDAVGANGCHGPDAVMVWGKTTGPVPEPSSMLALATGLCGLIPMLRRRRV